MAISVRKKTGLKHVFPLILTEVQKESRRSSVPVGSMERFCHTEWNLDLINLINCTWIYRHFSHQHDFWETGLWGEMRCRQLYLWVAVFLFLICHRFSSADSEVQGKDQSVILIQKHYIEELSKQFIHHKSQQEKHLSIQRNIRGM